MGREPIGYTYYFPSFIRPLKELARSKPSDVMALYSTSAKNFGSTHVAFGFLMGVVSFDFGLTTVSSCLRDRAGPSRPDLPM